ncbi:uncharacterized protein LOC144877385 [Branchiostoma floridae x Branchiostoma japonicum]
MPTSREAEPLLEIDADARNFEMFLMNHSPVLTVSDLRTFLPSTINLDPNIKTVIADELRRYRYSPSPTHLHSPVHHGATSPDLYETQLEAMLEGGQHSGSSHTLVSVGSVAAAAGAAMQVL